MDLNQTYANDVAIAIERGDVRGCSFFLDAIYEGIKWSKNFDGLPVRTISKLRIPPEITLTEFPAYPQTAVKVVMKFKKDLSKETLDKMQILQDMQANEQQKLLAEKQANAAETERKRKIVEALMKN